MCAAGGGSWERGRRRELGAHRHRLLAHKEKLQVKEREAAADVTEELRLHAESERSRERNSAGAVTKRGRGEDEKWRTMVG